MKNLNNLFSGKFFNNLLSRKKIKISYVPEENINFMYSRVIHIQLLLCQQSVDILLGHTDVVVGYRAWCQCHAASQTMRVH